MAYSFRIKFLLPPQLRLGIDSLEWLLSGPESTNRVSIKALRDNIKDASELVIVGEEYATNEQAKSAAIMWQDILSILFLRYNVGVDFGNRRANSGFTEYGLAMLGKNILNDLYGTMVYPTELKPSFVGLQMNGIAIKVFAESINDVELIKSQAPRLSDIERLAYDIYSSSKFIPQTDAHFLQIFLAIETLANTVNRNELVVEHIDNLIKKTEECFDLDSIDKESLKGGLESLKKEPMRKALMTLLGDLKTKKFQGREYQKIINQSYIARNKIVHSIHPLPKADLIRELSIALEAVFVDIFTDKYYR